MSSESLYVHKEILFLGLIAQYPSITFMNFSLSAENDHVTKDGKNQPEVKRLYLSEIVGTNYYRALQRRLYLVLERPSNTGSLDYFVSMVTVLLPEVLFPNADSDTRR